MFKQMARAGALVALTMGVISCEDDVVARPKVAAGDTKVPMGPMTVKALEGKEFTFASGIQNAMGLTGKPLKVKFTGTTGATPTTTFTVTGMGGGTAAATTRFGSCTFTITTSNITGVSVGETITVNPCQYIVATGGVQATGNATTVQILLQLGITPSAANQASVSIDPNTGVVTVNNVNTGVSVTLTVATGSTGE